MYQPLFQKLPESVADRFELVKQYARTWAGQTIEPPRDGHAFQLAAAEARLGQPLPTALASSTRRASTTGFMPTPRSENGPRPRR